MEHLVRGLKTENKELQKHCASAIFKVILYYIQSLYQYMYNSTYAGCQKINLLSFRERERQRERERECKLRMVFQAILFDDSVQRRRQPVHL